MPRVGLLALLIAVIPVAAAPVGPEIRWLEPGPGGVGEVQVLGLSRAALDGAARGGMALDGVFRIYVCPEPCDARTVEALPDLWGRIAAQEGVLSFRPRHTIAPGLTLVARFDGDAFDRLSGTTGTPSLELRKVFPLSDSEAPAVTGFYPSGDTLPENALRLYVTFSKPMSLRNVDRHVHLVTESGDDIPLALVDVPGGLWDPTRTRLTLFIHPGRVKQGVAPRETLGPALVAGSKVRLRIDPLAQSVDGRSLAAEASRTWRVGPAQRHPIDPSTWSITPPESPRDRLIVSFPHALDHALARRAITVRSDRGETVGGAVELEAGETRLVFTPTAPWSGGETYRLSVAPSLEDPAGNRLGIPFERMKGSAPLLVPAELRFAVPPR